MTGVRVRAALTSFGFGNVAPAPADFVDTDRVWMLGRKPLRIDILTGIGGVTWKEVWAGHIVVTISGLRLPVIGRRELIANKTAAGRPKDLADLASLARTRPESRVSRDGPARSYRRCR